MSVKILEKGSTKILPCIKSTGIPAKIVQIKFLRLCKLQVIATWGAFIHLYLRTENYWFYLVLFPGAQPQLHSSLERNSHGCGKKKKMSLAASTDGWTGLCSFKVLFLRNYHCFTFWWYPGRFHSQGCVFLPWVKTRLVWAAWEH